MISIAPKLFLITLLAVLLNGCSSVSQNYAPVFTPHSEAIKDETPIKNIKEDIKFHQVKKGDTLYAISLIYDLDYRQLAQWNQIAPPYKIEAGQKIKVSESNPADKNVHEIRDDMEHVDVAGKPQHPRESTTTTIPTAKPSPQKNTSVPLNLAPIQSGKPPYLTPPLKITSDTPPVITQKKSIISIDNEVMLKLNFRWPIKGKILKAFSKTDNKGIDIAGELGQDVNAAEAGKVVYSGQGLIGYGQLLIIKHNDLFLSAYANNSRLLVTEGSSVEKGQIIAKVGQAGLNKTALHFEIRKNGKPVNPLVFLPENQ